MEAVYRVLAPIPEIGALPGDRIVARPLDPDVPLSLCRHFDRNLLPIVLDERVTWIHGHVFSEVAELTPGPHRPSAREEARRRWALPRSHRFVG